MTAGPGTCRGPGEPGWEGPPPRSGRGRVVAGMLLGVVAVAALARLGGGTVAPTGELEITAVTPTPSPPPPTPASTPTSPPTTPSAVPSPPEVVSLPLAWRPLPVAPVPGRRDAATAWTGRELLLWGGRRGDRSRVELRGDGAALDLATSTWRALPLAPLAARADAAASWTGGLWFVWGGQGTAGQLGDGATYDPATNTWTPLPPAPISPRTGASAVWTGRQVLVLGGTDATGLLPDTAAYDPATRSWSLAASLSPPLRQGFRLEAAPDGDLPLVWVPERTAFDSDHGLGLPFAARYDLTGGRSTVLPTLPFGGLVPNVVQPTAGGPVAMLAAAGGRSELFRLPPGHGWEPAATAPRGVDPAHSTVVRLGELLAVVADEGPLRAALYDPPADRWFTVEPSGAVEGAQAVAAGAEILVIPGSALDRSTGVPVDQPGWRLALPPEVLAPVR